MKKLTATPSEKKVKSGLDYIPQRGYSKAISYGVVQRTKRDRIFSAHQIISKRLDNFEAGDRAPLEGYPTCARHDVLLPQYAPDRCSTARGLCDLFEEQALPHQRDLIAVLTLRFNHRDPRHRIWEVSREFLLERIVRERDLPVVLALHVPSIASRPTPPHCHALIFARRLPGPDFSEFDRQLLGDDAKKVLGDDWKEWMSTVDDISI